MATRIESVSDIAGIIRPADFRIDGRLVPIRPAPARSLLLVEDSVTNQLVASTLLKLAGYRVDVASNGLQAVSAVKSRPSIWC